MTEGSVVELLLSGLHSLEYRGYDSAGLCLHTGELPVVKMQGRVEELERAVEGADLPEARSGIAHTRWASHGVPSAHNAHPHRRGPIVLVHNGILENHEQLRQEVGVVDYLSETDSEVWTVVLEQELGEARDQPNVDQMMSALARTVKRARGSWALAIQHEALPDRIFFARHESPLVLGIGAGGRYLASDVPPLLEKTRDFAYLEDGQIGWITATEHQAMNQDLEPMELPVEHITWDAEQAEKGGYEHFMLKEIEEQPEVWAKTIQASCTAGGGFLATFDLSDEEIRAADRLVFLACGTALHAARYAKYLFEDLVGLPVEVDFASEYRYRNPLVDDKTIALAISQSGETADTLGALQVAIDKGATPIAICNVQGSSLCRKAQATLLTQCGPEIGVASTKAFTGQLVALHLLALKFAQALGRIDQEGVDAQIEILRQGKDLLAQQIGEEQRAWFEELGQRYADMDIFAFIGRGMFYPIAIEGALKVKEISYLHSEGYPAGEMKHGPLALVSDRMVVIGLCGPTPVYEKTIGNLREIKARGGTMLVVTTESMEEAQTLADEVVIVPESPVELVPLMAMIPIQYLAYYIALARGCDIDKPRNLAKSVTIE